MKRFTIYAMTLALATTLAGCSDSDVDYSGGSSYKGNIKLDHLDLTNATALALTSDNNISDAGSNTLLKMDADGNFSPVVLHLQMVKNETTTSTRTDISVHPREMQGFGKDYTYLKDCQFIHQKGHQVYLPTPDNSYSYNILVQNSTGKCYYVPAEAQNYFPYYCDNTTQPITDNSGNLYLRDTSGH